MLRRPSRREIVRLAALAIVALALATLGACCAQSPPYTAAQPGAAQPPAAAAPASAPVAEQPVAAARLPVEANEPVPEPTPAPEIGDDSGKPCPPAPCGNDCTNQPFLPTACWTTEYGPAKADVYVQTTNFLYCEGGRYALCFFSGPPEPTGKPRDRKQNPSLPCILQGDNLANCTCQVFDSGPYFVDMNGILNLGAWYQTVAACGADGSGCKNLEACGKQGKGSACGQLHEAPVCAYIRDQKAGDPSKSLIPGADVISAFSFAMDANYRVGSSTCGKGLYAGCMTAPCYFQEGANDPPKNGDPIQCMCPTYDGDFEIGQFREKDECQIEGGYVWSAAHKVGQGQ